MFPFFLIWILIQACPHTAPHYQTRHCFGIVLDQDPPLFVLRGVHQQLGPALGAAAEGKWTYPILQVVMMIVMAGENGDDNHDDDVNESYGYKLGGTDDDHDVARFGDGRAVLRSSVREFLCSEAMAALGVSRTFL